MRWGDMRRSDNVEDVTGGQPSGGGVPFGGGMKLGGGAMILIVIVSLLFGVNPLDPVTYILTTIGLCFAAGAASCIPALKATRADSVVALRSE